MEKKTAKPATTCTLILGNQLFPLKHYRFALEAGHKVFMAEDHELCTHFKYHKHKILLFLISMRRYRDKLQKAGHDITYRELPSKDLKKLSYTEALKNFIQDHGIKEIQLYEIEDKFFEQKLIGLFHALGLEITIHNSPQFIVSRSQFKDYLKRQKKPFMKTFYEELRQETGRLMNGKKPEGGQYSFDADNRKKLPKKVAPPEPQTFSPPDIPYFEKVSDLVNKHFSDHPGSCENFWLATSRKEALKLLREFINERLENFGRFQDAITSRSPFVFHSVLSPYINMGMLLPEEVIDRVEEAWRDTPDIPLNSVEGFIRQVLGWREFVRGIYQEFDEKQQSMNFFNHQRALSEHWYEGTTGIPPLDDAILKAVRFGYNHHIERLMVVSNLMFLCQIHPQEVYKWFMEMFVDSSDWVMGPNVFGMGQFSDGGLFATKPYVSGSNYLLKMGDYSKGPWCDVVDGLYWKFMSEKRDFLKGNHRLSMLLSSLDRMDEEKKDRIFRAADHFIENNCSLNKKGSL